MYKSELHAHTSECDKAAMLGGAELVRACSEKGYSGMIITEFMVLKKGFLQFFLAESNGKY